MPSQAEQELQAPRASVTTAASEPPSLHGSFVMTMRKTLPLAIGPRAYDEALAELDAEMRLAFVAATASGWVALETMETVLAAMARAAETTVPELHAQLSRMAMRKATSGVWRLVVKVQSDDTLLARTSFMFGKTYNRGSAVSKRLGEHSAEVVVTGWPDLPDYPIRGLSVGIQTLIEISGRNGVSVVSRRTPDGARFRITWEPS